MLNLLNAPSNLALERSQPDSAFGSLLAQVQKVQAQSRRFRLQPVHALLVCGHVCVPGHPHKGAESDGRTSAVRVPPQGVRPPTLRLFLHRPEGCLLHEAERGQHHGREQGAGRLSTDDVVHPNIQCARHMRRVIAVNLLCGILVHLCRSPLACENSWSHSADAVRLWCPLTAHLLQGGPRPNLVTQSHWRTAEVRHTQQQPSLLPARALCEMRGAPGRVQAAVPPQAPADGRRGARALSRLYPLVLFALLDP